MYHLVPLAASVAFWQCTANLIRAAKLPHALFNLAHHVTLSSLGAYFLFHRRFELISGPSMAVEAAIVAHKFRYAGAMISNVFLGYLVVDTLTRKRNAQPFKVIDWIHHALAATYAAADQWISPASLNAPLMAIQEVSSVFLTLAHLKVEHAWVKYGFLASFFFMRIGVGGAVVFQKLGQYFSRGGYNNQHPWYHLMSAFWVLQLLLNCFFAYKIALKLLKVSDKRV